MSLMIHCPTSPVRPGATVVVTGTTDDAVHTVATVSAADAAIEHRWECDADGFTITCIAPSLDAAHAHPVIHFTVALRGEEETCFVRVSSSDSPIPAGR